MENEHKKRGFVQNPFRNNLFYAEKFVKFLYKCMEMCVLCTCQKRANMTLFQHILLSFIGSAV